MKKSLSLFLLFIAFSFLTCRSIPKGEIADLIYHNGILITMDEQNPQATSVAVKNGKIISVSDQPLMTAHSGDSTQVIDLQGKTLLPGFIDAHSHMVMAMALVRQANLSSPPVGPVANIGDIIKKLKTQQEKYNIAKGDWIIGWGYDPDLLEEKRHPNKLDLDEFFPNNPVFLLHVSGHMAVVNSRALEMVGIDENTPDPPGGVIVRLPGTKEPDGLVQEMASYIFRKALPQPDLDQTMELLKEIQQRYASHGITTAQDGLTDLKNYQFLKKAAGEGQLIIDLEVLASFMDLEKYIQSYAGDFGKSDNGLRLAGVKIVSDGSPQGKTAFFSKPYLTKVPGCAHDCRGYPNLKPKQLQMLMRQCYENDIQLYTHANGDGAIDQFLESHQLVIDSMSSVPDDQRSVIIHSQFVRPDQLEMYKKYGMVPAYFSNHAFFWGDVHLENLGTERASFLSPLKTSMDMGIVCTNHTDYFITPIDQLFLLWTAVNRKTRSGKVLGEGERLSPLEGLKAITINAAYQHKQEAIKGSIETGKLADFVILAENPLTVDPDDIKNINILTTIKEGKVIYSSAGD